VVAFVGEELSESWREWDGFKKPINRSFWNILRIIGQNE